MQNIIIGCRRPFVEEYKPKASDLFFSKDDVDEVKQYYISRERFYQLAILASIVLAFFLGSITY